MPKYVRDGDSIEDLRTKLRSIPSDLEALFHSLLGQLDPTNLERASQLFQWVRAADWAMSLLDLSFAEDGLEKAIQAEIGALGPTELNYTAEKMRRRLNSRCKGLLEAPDIQSRGANAKVQYMHRTVKDYFTKPDVWDRILSGNRDSFDPNTGLCASLLFGLKTLKRHLEMISAMWLFVQWCIHYARKVADSARKALVPFLDELDRAATQVFEAWRKVADWKREGLLWYGSGDLIGDSMRRDRRIHILDEIEQVRAVGWKMGSFTDFALIVGLQSYVESKLGKKIPISHRVAGCSVLAIGNFH